MLCEQQLIALFDAQNIPIPARNRIQDIRREAPIRRTDGADKSVKVRYVSAKMGFVIEAEAFHTEYAAIRIWDNHPEIFELYPQPTKLNISYKNPSGRQIGVSITPDAFLIGKQGFVFVECKMEEELLRLSIKSPERFLKEGDRWRSPPAEKAAAELGCQFVIRSSAENNWMLISNLEFLEDYLRVRPTATNREEEERILGLVAEKRFVSTRDLIADVGTSTAADTLYRLIAENRIYFDLQAFRLAIHDSAIVFKDALLAETYRHVQSSKSGTEPGWAAPLDLTPGRHFSWDGQNWEILNVSNKSVFAREIAATGEQPAIIELQAEHLEQLCRQGSITVARLSTDSDPRFQEQQQRLRALPADALQVANQRYRVLFENAASESCIRTQKYWKKRFREAEVRYGLGLLGLIPNQDSNQGNRTSRIPVEVEEEIHRIFKDEWSKPHQVSYQYCWGLLKSYCDQHGYQTPTPKTFRNRGRRLIDQHDQLKRIGSKRAYQVETQYLSLEYTTPPHGERPFHIAHIDHTPIDLALRDSEQKEVLKSAILTLMIDAYSRVVLAWYITFDKPSYRSCMMVIRECVRRHGRFPQFIVTDQGSEFGSVYYETLLAQYHCHKKERPRSKCRHGSVIERIFNTSTTQFTHNLMGNTKAWRHFRQVSRDVDPKRLARWTYGMLEEHLGRYFTEVYPHNHHSTLGTTPMQRFVEGLKYSGLREHTLIPYDKHFIANTCPSTPKGKAKVSPRGVKINYRYYTCGAIAGARHHGAEYPVRYDPFNLNHGFVYVDGCWHECLAYDAAIMPPLTEKALRIVTATLKLDFRSSRQASELNAVRIAEYLQQAEEDMALMAQLLREQETAATVERLSTPLIPANTPESDGDESGLNRMHPFSSGQPQFEPQLLESF